MNARVTRVEGQPDRIDEGIEQVRSSVLPTLQSLSGFKGFSLLVDRSSGTLVGVSYWDDEQALAAVEGAIRDPREQVVQATGAAPARVEEFEVVIDTQA